MKTKINHSKLAFVLALWLQNFLSVQTKTAQDTQEVLDARCYIVVINHHHSCYQKCLYYQTNWHKPNNACNIHLSMSLNGLLTNWGFLLSMTVEENVLSSIQLKIGYQALELMYSVIHSWFTVLNWTGPFRKSSQSYYSTTGLILQLTFPDRVGLQ